MLQPQGSTCCFRMKLSSFPMVFLGRLASIFIVFTSAQTLTRGVGAAKDETPQVVFLRRQVRQYGDGQQASITLVYYSRFVGDGGLRTRWFRPAPNNNLPYAELANKLPTDGDDNYMVNTISAGNVVASTLVIKRVKVRAFPHEYSIVVNIKDHPMQYTVTTRIWREITTRTDYLDAIHWLRVPPPTISFGYSGSFTITCRAEIDRESRGSLDELHMYRTYIEREVTPGSASAARSVAANVAGNGVATAASDNARSSAGHLMSVSCGAIHRDRDNYVEESGKYKQVGVRFVRRRVGITEFELIFRVQNASLEDQGMYACAMERSLDRAYVSTWVRQGALRVAPLVEFIPCEAHSFDRARSSLIAEGRKETCFRCRGTGHPQPQVAVLREGQPLQEIPGLVLVDRHVNVADGGLAEVTYTFLDPTYEDEGAYECRVENPSGRAAFPFNLVIV